MTRRGGATDTLPLPADLAEGLRTWDFYYVTAHGLFEPRMMIVPPKTYVLNTATAGRSCLKLDAVIESLIYEDPAERAPAAAVGAPPQDFRKLYAAIQAKSFLKNSLRGVEPTEHIFTPETVNRNKNEVYQPITAENILAGRNLKQYSLSFYEPGDIMFDTSLHFMNNLKPLFLMGVYRIPVPFSIRERVFEANRPVLEPSKDIFTVDQYNIRNIPQDNPIWNATEEEHQIFNTRENLLQPMMFPEVGGVRPSMYLSEVIESINARSDPEKQKFYMVKACRSTEDEGMSKRARRLSIAARSGRIRPNIPAEEIAINPRKRFRTPLNIELLGRTLPNLEILKGKIESALQKNLARLDTLTKEKVELIAKKEWTKKKAYDIYTLENEIDDNRRESAKINESLEIIHKILRYESFSMDELYKVLSPVKSTLQPQLRELLEL